MPPSLHRNPIDGRWNVLAPERGQRPNTAPAPASGSSATPPCPFCPGHEEMTVAAVHVVESTDEWITRTVPNRYPAFTIDAAHELREDRVAARGIHEVIVVTPDHSRRWTDVTDAEIDGFVEAIVSRCAAHAEAGLEYSQLLVNYGRAAGASIEHIHAQLISMGITPPTVEQELAQLASPECVLCRVTDHRHDSGPLVIGSVGDWIAMCPEWSATPYEILMAPRLHERTCIDAGHESTRDLIACVRSCAAALASAIGDVAFNVVVHVAPASAESFHWHAHIWPALVNTSGFERGTGIYINVVPPDAAARELRASFPVA